LGGAVTIHTVTHTLHNVAGVILENTFTSMGDMVDDIFPKLAYFKKFILKKSMA